MITTGYPRSSATRKTEIIDIASGGVTCSDLENFPVEISGGVGGNLQGTPVVCGGYHSTYSDKCYKFTTTGGWQEFASMKDKRGIAAAWNCLQKEIACLWWIRWLTKITIK